MDRELLDEPYPAMYFPEYSTSSASNGSSVHHIHQNRHHYHQINQHQSNHLLYNSNNMINGNLNYLSGSTDSLSPIITTIVNPLERSRMTLGPSPGPHPPPHHRHRHHSHHQLQPPSHQIQTQSLASLSSPSEIRVAHEVHLSTQSVNNNSSSHRSKKQQPQQQSHQSSHRSHRRRRSRNPDESEVSCCMKYLIFGSNAVFWLIGLSILLIGIWAWSEKDYFTNWSQIANLTLDPAFILIVIGCGTFIIGFTGCVGALRENTCLLAGVCNHTSPFLSYNCRLIRALIMLIIIISPQFLNHDHD